MTYVMFCKNLLQFASKHFTFLTIPVIIEVLRVEVDCYVRDCYS